MSRLSPLLALVLLLAPGFARAQTCFPADAGQLMLACQGKDDAGNQKCLNYIKANTEACVTAAADAVKAAADAAKATAEAAANSQKKNSPQQDTRSGTTTEDPAAANNTREPEAPKTQSNEGARNAPAGIHTPGMSSAMRGPAPRADPVLVNSEQKQEKYPPKDSEEAFNAKAGIATPGSAKTYASGGDTKSAERLGREMARTAPSNAAGLAMPAAGREASYMSREGTRSPEVLRSRELRRAGHDMGALEQLTLHLDQNPDDLDARLERSDVLLKLGKAEAALADAEAVLAKTPNDPRALRAAAAALLALGRFAEALSMIDKALAIEPDSGPGHYTRARILEKLGRIEEAIAAYKRAAELDPVVAVMAQEALKRLRETAGDPLPPASLLGGGLIVGSLIFLVLGLMGGARMVTQRRAAQKASAPAVPDSERTFSTGDLIGGQYRISRELGRGGMGLVFEAVDETLKRRVALKQMQAEFRVSAEDTARFLQEARLVAQLRHPNIAEIHAAVDDGGLFLVFELIDGMPLDKLLASGGALKEAEARRVVGDLCGALACAHARRIIHRDLKPANVMRTGSGLHKVMDFGIAHQARSAASTQTSASGTPPYMAPEQVMGTVLPASDLYALAVMTYELLAGTRPFPGPDFLGPKMRGEFAPISRHKPGLPPGLDAFFASALAPDPSRRPADAETFRKAFEACWDVKLSNTVVS